jgi:hypothetical protein
MPVNLSIQKTTNLQRFIFSVTPLLQTALDSNGSCAKSFEDRADVIAQFSVEESPLLQNVAGKAGP